MFPKVLFYGVILMITLFANGAFNLTFDFQLTGFGMYPACDALLPSEIQLITEVDENGNTTVSIVNNNQVIVAEQIYVSYWNDLIPAFQAQIVLQNGKDAPGLISMLQIPNTNVFRVDIYVNTSSFRSSDLENLFFTEHQVCAFLYVTTSTEEFSTTVEITERDADICTFSSNFQTMEAVVDCIKAIPFSDSVRDSTIDSLKKVIDMYAYRDINKNSGGDDPIQVDIIEELNVYATKTYSYDLEFHTDLYQLFISARDVHTQYQFPLCYTSYFLFFQPWKFFSAIDELTGEQVLAIYTDPNSSLEIFQELLHFNPISFENYYVDSIQGQDAMTYFVNWVDNNIADKQRSNRFNAGLSKFNIRQVIPEESELVYQLRNPVTNEKITLTVPWFSSIRTGLNLDSITAACQTLDSPICGTTNSKREIMKSFENSKFNERSFTATVVDSLGEFTLTKVNEQTSTLRIPTFHPINSDQWLFQVLTVLYLNSIHRFHFEQLIIDVSGNPGGLIVSGLQFSQIVDPTIKEYADIMDFDQIHSEFWDNAISIYFNNLTDSQKIEIANEGYSNLFLRSISGSSFDPSIGDSWYFPGKNYTRGGTKSTYSQKIELEGKIGDLRAEFVNEIISSSVYLNYSPENTLILTNGLCYSTCSFFIRSLQTSSNPIKVVGYGGLVGQPLRSSDVPANIQNLVSMNTLGTIFETQFGHTEFANYTPKLFPFYQTCGSPTTFQFAFLETYEPEDSTVPLEFTISNVDIRLNIWPKTSSEVYPIAAELFYENPQSTYGTVSITESKSQSDTESMTYSGTESKSQSDTESKTRSYTESITFSGTESIRGGAKIRMMLIFLMFIVVFIQL